VNMISTSVSRTAIALVAGLTLASGAIASSPYSRINAAAAADPILVTKLQGNITMLSGSGGNIGVLTGPDGFLLVDAGIAVSKAKIEAALRSVGKGPVRYVVNTHWHWDHTDGNEWLRHSGATIIADQHARRRLTQTIRIVEWEHTFSPVNRQDLPNEILTHDRLMTFGSESIVIRHYLPGHTDGDLSVFFKKADVLVTGDTFWNGMYPFIDYVGGGGIEGAIHAAAANLAAAGPLTQIIPGHGPLGNRAQLGAFHDMLVEVRSRVAALKANGQSEDQVVAARPTASFDAKWGHALIDGDLFARLVYQGV
jgi:glyoxylase-like metal-dependent hydrolase (beta-lactamase superfamily II)